MAVYYHVYHENIVHYAQKCNVGIVISFNIIIYVRLLFSCIYVLSLDCDAVCFVFIFQIKRVTTTIQSFLY